MTRAIVLAILATLVLATPALASERHPTLGELQGEVMCPVCGTTLDQSTSPAAQQVDRFIERRIAARDTKSEIKRKLVAQYGPAILAEPSKHGFAGLAWWLPIGGVLLAAALTGYGAWRWTKLRTARRGDDAAPLDPALARRLDEELARFDG